MNVGENQPKKSLKKDLKKKKSHTQTDTPIRILLLIIMYLISMSPPGMFAGDNGPVRGVLALAGEPAGDGEGPRIPGRWGDV